MSFFCCVPQWQSILMLRYSCLNGILVEKFHPRVDGVSSRFWSCSFVDPLVKVTNNFWKIRGLIDGLNELRRQIASGREKTADESMRAIRFRTTPKQDLPHYSYIFRKPETLGTEMNNVACSRLGTMLHLKIQKGKGDMKILTFQSELGGTAACMKRLAISTKGCGQLTSNDTYFADSWFRSVKTAEDMAAAGVNYCGPVKTSHKGFCLATLEKLMRSPMAPAS